MKVCNAVQTGINFSMHKTSRIENKEMPMNVRATCLSLKPMYAREWVVWSFPPTKGDCLRRIRLINTVVVSTMGTINMRTGMITCLKSMSSAGGTVPACQKNFMPTAERNTPKNWLPVSPI